MIYYNDKTHELNDTKIVNTLRKLPEMYENGEIAECQDFMIDIVNAIDAWERNLARSFA